MTMMTWMVWSALVAVLFTASAWLAEGALRERGWATRWTWMTALVASVVAPVVAFFRPAAAAHATAASERAGGWTLMDPAWLAELSTSAVAARPTSASLDDALLGAWILGSFAVLGAVFVGLTVLRTRASRWHRARVHDEYVLLSPDFGPALIGLVHPEIVLPRWALRMPEEDQRLACLHEAEHRAARDTWILLAGVFCVAAMPWNPVLWMQLRRLRAAVEVDCDGRVLRRGASRRAYGALLLELGSARRPGPLTALALARSESLLERRLKMIVRNVRDRHPARALCAACLSAALLVVACETEPPTSVQETPQAAVEAGAESTIQAKELPFGPSTQGAAAVIGQLKESIESGKARLYFDGEERGSLPADLDPSDVDRVEVRKTEEGEASAVYVFSKENAAALNGDAGKAQPEAGSTIRIRSAESGGEPLVYVDGVRVEGVWDLAPESIERVEVLKGEAARALYGDEAANGVVRVTLKEVPPAR